MSVDRSSSIRSAAAALIAALGATACSQGPGAGFAAPGRQSASSAGVRRASGSNLIQHVVIIVQENRSFDDLFATFPGADGTTTGQTSTGQSVPLAESNLQEPCDLGHSRQGYVRDYDQGKMDGFNLEGGSGSCGKKAGSLPYQYVNPAQIAPYWSMAQQYVLGDQMFQTQGSGSFTAHQDLIAGATIFNQSKMDSLVDFPSHGPWGCDAPIGTTTSYLQPAGKKLKYHYHKGPFPCMGYETMRDLLDAQGISWAYYAPAVQSGGGAEWNGFEAIQAVREGPEWTTNISSPETNIFNDITNGTLASVVWVVPDRQNSDHPGAGLDTGPSWVASVVNAIGQSQYWPSTAIVVLWDDWGGFYDHVPPPFIDDLGGLGFRVPMLVISPYAVQGSTTSGGYVSHTQYEFGSVLKFVEGTWNLGSLGTTDVRANSILDCFDFTQQPRPFTIIPSVYSKAFFLHQRPSGRPVDDE